MSGGVIAALILGLLAIIAILLLLLQRKSRKQQHQPQPQQQQQRPAAAHVHNEMYDHSLDNVGTDNNLLPSGAFVASTLEQRMQRQQGARSNAADFKDYSTPNIPNAAEIRARARNTSSAAGAGAARAHSMNSIAYAGSDGSTMTSSSSSRTKDVYDGVTYNGIPLNDSGNANTAVQYRPIYAVNAGANTSNDRSSNLGTYSSTSAPLANRNYAHPLNKEDKPAVVAPSLPVRRVTKRATCQRPSPKGGMCKNLAVTGSKYCTSHACPAKGCHESKSSGEASCSNHANGSGSGNAGGGNASCGSGNGISRKARDGSTYDGFGGSGGGGNAGTVDGYNGSSSSNAVGNKGVVRGKQSVYGGFDEEEEV